MLKAIHDSIEHLCTDVLGLRLEEGKSYGKDFYGSSIPLILGNKESHYYLFLKADTLNSFGKVLLSDKSLDEDALSDLCKEVSNMIVGRAKANLSDMNPKNRYTLGTPEYLGKVSYPFPVKLDDFNIYKLKNRTFIIGIKYGK